MPRLAIILTAILSISACGGGGSSGVVGALSVDQPIPQSVLFDPSGTNDQVAQDIRDSVGKNKNYINYTDSFEEYSADEFFQYSIKPDTKLNKISIIALKEKTNEKEDLSFSVNKQTEKDNVATIHLQDNNIVKLYGLVFPYGFVIRSKNNAIIPIHSRINASVQLLEGHTLRLNPDTQFSKNKKVLFGGAKTRTVGEKYIFNANIQTDDLFQLTIELEYLGYDDMYSGLHEMNIKVLGYKLNSPSYSFIDPNNVDFQLSKITYLYNFDTIIPQATSLVFNPNEAIEFRLKNCPDRLCTYNDDPAKKDNFSWSNLSDFRVAIFGTGINNLYMAGQYHIDINKHKIYPGTVINDDDEVDSHWGIFVLPKQ